MVELSVVIPTIEESDGDIKALQYIRRCSFEDYEVIVRRDSSASKARNKGAERAQAEKIVFFDDDSMPCEGHLQAASNALNEHDAVAGRVFQPDDSPFKNKEIPWYDQGEEQKQTTLLPGCNMAMNKTLFENVGGFNENLPFGHEEVELAERICRDHRIHYEPEMVIYHYFAESVWGYWKKAYRHGKADTRIWELDGFPWSKRVVQSLPLARPNAGPIEIISRLARRTGRIRGLLAT
ncbi:glycosyltransferase [Haloarcula sp. 1CSR25-25]|uniref:glycosyltransferase family 2 protein n=1 Tax=Haloarcula sp. 1CSR25-25 TaxID=2862545 RepID=UPI002893AD94|nr:glycosyltransferase [Haloarcula sp. 1CSR25-25]MDT3435466.1 glycosyltransferase [Haloarcula sp. 1CSR25-25]